MSCTMGNTDKMAEYLEECRQLGIDVLPPDVNASDLDFTIEDHDGKPKIRFGLGAVKNVGDRAVLNILEARRKSGRFQALYDFAEAIEPHAVDHKAVESLVKCGAFDSTGLARAQCMEILESALRIGALKQQDRRAGQLTMFGGAGGGGEYPPVPDVPEWAQESLLAFEKEALGFYVTSNPVVRYEEEIRAYSTASVDRLPDLEDGTEVCLGGRISGLRAVMTKSGPNAGKRYLTFKLHDLTGTCEGVVFSQEFDRNRDHLVDDAIVFLRGRVSFRNEEPSLRVSEVIPIERARELLTASVRVILPSSRLDDALVEEVRGTLSNHPGQCPVILEVQLPEGKRVAVQASNQHFVSPSNGLLADLTDLLGPGHVRLAGKPANSGGVRGPKFKGRK